MPHAHTPGPLLTSWVEASRKADELHLVLNVLPEHASCRIIRREGLRPGWRITVIRYKDAMSSTVYVADCKDGAK